MSHSNHNASNVNTNGSARRMSNVASSGALQRVTSDVEPKEEKEEREIELQIRLVNGDKFTIVAHIEDLVWDVKQKVSQIPPLL